MLVKTWFIPRSHPSWGGGGLLPKCSLRTVFGLCPACSWLSLPSSSASSQWHQPRCSPTVCGTDRPHLSSSGYHHCQWIAYLGHPLPMNTMSLILLILWLSRPEIVSGLKVGWQTRLQAVVLRTLWMSRWLVSLEQLGWQSEIRHYRKSEATMQKLVLTLSTCKNSFHESTTHLPREKWDFERNIHGRNGCSYKVSHTST